MVKDCVALHLAFFRPGPLTLTLLASPRKRLNDLAPGLFSTVSTTIEEVSFNGDGFLPDPNEISHGFKTIQIGRHKVKEMIKSILVKQI